MIVLDTHVWVKWIINGNQDPIGKNCNCHEIRHSSCSFCNIMYGGFIARKTRAASAKLASIDSVFPNYKELQGRLLGK